MPTGARPDPPFRLLASLREYHRGSRDAHRLVIEAEAFLRGGIGTVYRDSGQAIPGWAALNWLAHGRPEEVIDHTMSRGSSTDPFGSWAWAVGQLAETVVQATAWRSELIARVQHHCIVPMELALLWSGRTQCRPDHLVALGVPRILRCAGELRGTGDL